MDDKFKSNAFWFFSALTSPYLVFYTGNLLLSLIWSDTRDIPKTGLLLPIDIFPYLLAIGALIYCFSEIHFSSWKAKLLVISALLANIAITGLYLVLVTVCAVWHDCL